MDSLEDGGILNKRIRIHTALKYNVLLTRPMLPEGVRPRPPINPAHISDRMSPYKLGMTMTRSEYGLGLVTIYMLESVLAVRGARKY